jgi:hypothetical protein
MILFYKQNYFQAQIFQIFKAKLPQHFCSCVFCIAQLLILFQSIRSTKMHFVAKTHAQTCFFGSFVNFLPFHTVPVIVSGIFYALLVHSRSNNCKRQLKKPPSRSSSESISSNPSNDKEIFTGGGKQLPAGTKMTSNQVMTRGNLPGTTDYQPRERKHLQTEMPDRFEYNTILQDCGLPYDNSGENPIALPHTSWPGKGYFGIRRKKIIQKAVPKDCNESENHATKLDVSEDLQLRTETHFQEPHNQISTVCRGINRKKQSPIDQTLQCAMRPSRFDADAIETDLTFDDKADGNLSGVKTKDESQASIHTNHDFRTANDEEAETARLDAEKIAVMRSLKTNLLLILICFISNSFLLIPSKFWQMYFCVVYWFVFQRDHF